MARAAVGDDVLDEDPTVQELEACSAALLGKEDALFLVSGTMANQVAVMCLCRHGQEIILPDASHIYNLEVGALATLAGVQARPLPAPRGVYAPDQLDGAIRAATLQEAESGLVCLENTFDLNRGLVVSPKDTDAMARQAKARDLPVYLDGARLFNAAVALGLPASRLVASVDAVAYCLSKGLACPIGAVLHGSRPFIAEARRARQRLGGGWRQAGVLAAAGLVALSEMIDRLANDHARAKRLAGLLAQLGFGIDPADVETNIQHVDLRPVRRSATAFASDMAERGVKVKVIAPQAIRMVTHKDVHDGDLERVAEAASRIITRRGGRRHALAKTPGRTQRSQPPAD